MIKITMMEIIMLPMIMNPIILMLMVMTEMIMMMIAMLECLCTCMNWVSDNCCDVLCLYKSGIN